MKYADSLHFIMVREGWQMGVSLFKHNQTAYEAALAMLAERGRAAVIHPTGTGKSFIAFALCAEHPESPVLWLSPSEYIFQTQMENWKAAGGGDLPNIHFCTYARLMRMSEEEAAELFYGAVSIIRTHTGGTDQISAIRAHADGSDQTSATQAYTGGNAQTAVVQAHASGNAQTGSAHADRSGQFGSVYTDESRQLQSVHTEDGISDASGQERYIVLDEFHRCGAQMWGAGVKRLLEKFPDVPVLGLSATNIRYLDGQRDMAQELFGGNIASELTLGEAIVRGILHPPKYVLSLYSYQKDLETYEKRVRSAKNKAVREIAEKYLEALRRALEKADGMDEIFAKHMTERAGRYLVFCADYEHMQEMIGKVPEWFHKVDAAPHIYTAYSEDPATDRAFQEFKADRSDHLKLLFCIDMLNEGVHVEDVSGVILLRPTISPIIYKQQIGRALAAGAKRNAVIFDVVMNIENLYSIGTLEAEMQAAAIYYRSLGLEKEIVNEHFQVIDEVQDCVKLFTKLNETLGASWNLMYAMAERYYGEHGTIDVPKRYMTEEGFSLGQWLDTQRKVRAGKVKGILTEGQIKKLDALGMRWQGKADAVWERYYAAAKKYYGEHGDLLVNVRNGKYEGLDLGKWLAQMRVYKKGGIKGAFLTQERMKALDAIGMVWDVPDYLWEQNYAAAMRYHREHGNLEVPYHYVDKDGVRLGVWLANLRFARRHTENENGRAELTAEQFRKLDDLGMIWENRNGAAWEKSYEAACRYQKKYGNLNVPATYVTEDGLKLGRWLRRQREAYRTGISAERKRKLEAAGIRSLL